MESLPSLLLLDRPFTFIRGEIHAYPISPRHITDAQLTIAPARRRRDGNGDCPAPPTSEEQTSALVRRLARLLLRSTNSLRILDFVPQSLTLGTSLALADPDWLQLLFDELKRLARKHVVFPNLELLDVEEGRPNIPEFWRVLQAAPRLSILRLAPWHVAQLSPPYSLHLPALKEL